MTAQVESAVTATRPIAAVTIGYLLAVITGLGVAFTGNAVLGTLVLVATAAVAFVVSGLVSKVAAKLLCLESLGGFANVALTIVANALLLPLAGAQLPSLLTVSSSWLAAAVGVAAGAVVTVIFAGGRFVDARWLPQAK